MHVRCWLSGPPDLWLEASALQLASVRKGHGGGGHQGGRQPFDPGREAERRRDGHVTGEANVDFPVSGSLRFDGVAALEDGPPDFRRTYRIVCASKFLKKSCCSEVAWSFMVGNRPLLSGSALWYGLAHLTLSVSVATKRPRWGSYLRVI